MKQGFILALTIVVLAVSVVLANSLFVVDETEQALVTRFGEPKETIREPGLYFKVPIAEVAHVIDKRVLNLDTVPAEVLAADQKRLVVDAFARFQIVDPLRYYQTVNNELAARARLTTILNAALRNVVARQEMQVLLSDRRPEVLAEIQQAMNVNVEPLGIEVVDVRIRRADLPEQNLQATYSRMQTERRQEAEEARAQGREAAQRIRAEAERNATVIQAEAQRDSQIIRGQGDAERNRIFADAFGRDPEFFAFYRALQAYEASLNEDTTVVLSPDSEFFRYFNEFDRSTGAPAQQR